MTTTIPSHPLPPTSDRRWRLALIAVAIVLLLLTAASLALASAASAATRRGFADVPAERTIGRPTDLAVTTTSADLTIASSSTVQEVTVRLVSARTRIPARIDVRTDAATGRTTVSVDQPRSFIGIGLWDDRAAPIQVLVPEDLAPRITLAGHTDVGDAHADGAFAALAVTTDTGGVTLTSVASTGAITARSQTGDVDVDLADGAVPQSVSAASDVGGVHVAVPGNVVYRVDAATGTGDAEVDAGIDGPSGPSLRARTDVGDVRITR